MDHLSSEFHEDGEHIYTEDRCSAKIMVIESGFVNVYFPELLLRLDSSELLRMLGTRPLLALSHTSSPSLTLLS